MRDLISDLVIYDHNTLNTIAHKLSPNLCPVKIGPAEELEDFHRKKLSGVFQT